MKTWPCGSKLQFSDIRPFFCQVEAAETIIWLTEVAPHLVGGKALLNHLVSANSEAGTNLQRVALKLATGAGKTAVMAMLIAWQTVNAVRRPGSKTFTRGFLVVTPGLTVRDRLRVLNSHDPDNYYATRELVPGDMLPDLKHAVIVITNYHAFRLRERIEISKGARNLLKGHQARASVHKHFSGHLDDGFYEQATSGATTGRKFPYYFGSSLCQLCPQLLEAARTL